MAMVSCDKSTKVGFIGLGLMGEAIATNIAKAGFPVQAVVHRNRAPLDRLSAIGVTEAKTGSELASQCDVVLICVTGTSEVKDALYRPSGILEGAHDGLVVIDCSTCDPGFAQESADSLLRLGCSFADAPINRTPKEALEGKLNVLFGGETSVLEFTRPILECFSETIHHLGPIGSGYRAKLIHNFISQANAVILAEAFCLAAKLKIDLRSFVDVCRLSGAHSKAFDRLIPFVLTGDDSGQQFTIRNALKDVSAYTRLTEMASTTALAASAVEETYLLATSLGHGDKYLPRIFEALGDINGVKVTTEHLDTARGK